MMTHLVRFGSAALAAACLSCSGGSFSLAYHDYTPVVEPVHVQVVERPHVRVTHVCTRDCNQHYWNGAKLVVLERGHRHGLGCGHRWSGKRWLVVAAKASRKARARGVHVRGPRGGSVHVRHVHGPRCGHAFDRRGSKWLAIRAGHVHGPRCGHVLIHGRWSIRH